jgi:hypothetical protein
MQEGKLGLRIKSKSKGIADDTRAKILITYYNLFHIAYFSHSSSIESV